MDPLLAAIDWAEKNPDAWWQIYDWALEDIEHGQRPSIALYVELLRRPHFANKLRLQKTDTKFLINNNLRADLARLYNRCYDLGFRTRDAGSDRFFSSTIDPEDVEYEDRVSSDTAEF